VCVCADASGGIVLVLARGQSRSCGRGSQQSIACMHRVYFGSEPLAVCVALSPKG
jgi:hypothetical protein